MLSKKSLKLFIVAILLVSLAWASYALMQSTPDNRADVASPSLQTALANEAGFSSVSIGSGDQPSPQNTNLRQSVCGDGECQIGEESTCPQDCGTGCLPQTCPPGQTFDLDLCKCVPAASCGNSVCESGETRKNCPQDCDSTVPKVYCGNGVCESSENSSDCPQDCAPPSYCGDGLCDLLSENPTSCPKDCNASVCGNAVCETDLSEDAVNCPADCLCGNGKCDTRVETRDNCPRDCYAECGNGACQIEIGENNKICPADCRTVCGDRICDMAYGESDADCPIDCDPNCNPYSEKYKEASGLTPLRCSVCGNNVCETLQGETNANCAADCKTVCGDFRCDLNMGETYPNCPKDCSLSCGNGGCERDKENVLTCPADCPMTAVKCRDGKCDPGEAVVCRECLGDGLCDFGEERVSSGIASDCQKPQPRPCAGPAAPLALVGVLAFARRRRVT